MKYAPEELWDSREVAEYLGLNTNRTVSTYAARYVDFPTPVINKGSGRAMLWYRPDIEGWATKRETTPPQRRR